ncbi:MAG: glycerol-3-phosphate dehydrogenase, partial [Holdemanella sp.]|nr:glycerol-3-phosphate dehydrogenase [Holdemanella sp.]
YTGNDEIGSELGVAIKNAMAIASGIISGLGYADNTRAALITRGLQEMIRFGTAFGGKAQTFVGLTGVGDLIVTCSSIHSRNFQCGYQIGKENDVKNFFATNTKTVEGVRTAKIVHYLAREKGIEMPICEEVYQILYCGKEPKTCAQSLMLRDLKKEF